ncbi:MAG TPA: hypothetical protein VG076_02170 [Acidimicrobiales bacterium]|jgi:hypothetical protein|nr:hypothetical protein [Acidimicrobiales bacterium]
MAVGAKKTEPLSDEQLGELLALAKESDSVELKLTVPDTDQRSAITALELDPLEAQVRQVFFFDTPDLALNRQGVVVRARRVQGRNHDSVVKLRPVVPNMLPAKIRKSPNLVTEVDAMPGGFVCSAAMKGTVDTSLIRKVVSGGNPLHKLYSKEQRAFYNDHASGIDLDSLNVLGPITLLKLKFSPKELGRRMVAEAWFYPDGSRILELSTKCAPSEAFQVAAETKACLAGHGVDLTGEQQTKTSTALKFFSAELTGTTL